MVRDYVRKRSDPVPKNDILRKGVKKVLQKEMSIRHAASFYGLKKSTLADYVKKVKNNGGVIPINLKPEKHSTAIFSIEWEAEMVKYLLICS